jgi:hypothetical protein
LGFIRGPIFDPAMSLEPQKLENVSEMKQRGKTDIKNLVGLFL